MAEFPPTGWQCNSEETYIPTGEKPDQKCQAELTMSGPPGADPGMPGVGPSQLCWQLAGPGAPDPSELTSGNCDPESGCSVTLVMQLNVEPTDPNHDPKEHYEYWHGKGTYGPPKVKSKDPKWTTGGPSAGGVIWGPPTNPGTDPNGDSVPYVVVTISTDKCAQGNMATITATPAQGGAADAISLDITLHCSDC